MGRLRCRPYAIAAKLPPTGFGTVSYEKRFSSGLGAAVQDAAYILITIALFVALAIIVRQVERL
ncbi:hypothetical protein Ais01nite_24460 [Asanoa ishikariensis]|uniref:Uncharacterized protein n=1 Tax=Asanoa ishikariensis TaxID=137265 RepID=A0A1H3R5W3_9ACTN|nr:hypothetical protein Ais01nite_24460 [Asanoa ishikariensis]SDZ20705.1 hypothetical protein SAMN05421684_3472 [Asanoa ishikariensis]